MRMITFGRMIQIFVLILFVLPSVSNATGLMPDDIVKMQESGKSVDHIIEAIKTNGVAFEVDKKILEQMIQNGVEQKVLAVLINSTPIPATPGASSSLKHSISFSASTQPGIAIITDPPGLLLQIDGIDHGETPSFSNKIEAGKHIIKVSHPLFFLRQEEIQFDGKESVVINWQMEPREPLIRVNVNIKRGNSKEPWSWIIRPRGHCPGCEVNVKFQAWKSTTNGGEAVFLLADESKRLFRGNGIGCLEFNMWKGEIRRDLPLRKLPPPLVQYFLTDIRIDGIKTIDIRLDIEVRELNPMNPEVKMVGDTGYLIQAELSAETKQKRKTYEEMIETLDGVIQ